MRDYGKVSPTFWTGETGKEIRKGGSEALVVGLYLMTSPMSNMLGLYNQPILYMAHETSLGLEGAKKGLAWCESIGFCKYDPATEMVWVVEMAHWQIAKQLKASDNRCIGIQKEYDSLPNNAFLAEFFDHYQASFYLSEPRAPKGATQAPTKPRAVTRAIQEQDKTPPPSKLADLFPGVSDQVIADFRKLRKAKRAEITPTAVSGIQREAEKCGMTLEAAMITCCERGWAGFKAEWITKDQPQLTLPHQTSSAAGRKL